MMWHRLGNVVILGLLASGCGSGPRDEQTPTSSGTGTSTDASSSTAEAQPETSTDETTGGDSSTGPSLPEGPYCDIRYENVGPCREGRADATRRPNVWLRTQAEPDVHASSDSDADAGFLPEPDVGGDVRPCDLWLQDCPSGEKCNPWIDDGGVAWNAARCVPLVDRPNAIGDPCNTEDPGSGIDDCELGAMCFNAIDGVGTCIELCNCTPDQPQCSTPGTYCSITNDGDLPLCFEPCNPLDPAACPDQLSCFVLDEAFACVLVAAPEGTEVGEPCDYTNFCPPTSLCVSADAVPGCEAERCCTHYCEVGTDIGCLDGQVCQPVFEAPVDACVGSVGLCQIEGTIPPVP